MAILDTLPEAFSDAVVTAAAAIANVPIAAISLVDTERQWFKGSCGLDVTETPRDVSFCTYAIAGSGPFVVDDALLDDRFRENPLVTGAPHVRFYAGFPLVVAGVRVGSLCVIDDRPRRLDEEAIDRLAKLAAGTATWLADRHALRDSLARTEKALRYITFHDLGTGLPNRLFFQDRLRQAIAAPGPESKGVAVMAIEIDGFGASGHACDAHDHDLMLRVVSDRLRRGARTADLVAYAGGAHFLVCLARSPDRDAVLQLANQLREALVVPCPSGSCSARTSASIGIAVFPEDGNEASLVANANTASTIARDDGGNRCRFFKERMNLEARAKTGLVEELRLAIVRNELHLLFQPKIHATKGKVAGVEALVRWLHPKRGVVGPDVFIGLAEQYGLIDAVGRWVVDEACRCMKEWRDAGLLMRVAINLSVHELYHPALANHIAEALDRNGVDPTLLTCEITETVAMGDPTVVLALFERLSAIGIQLSIDDFGTGYSSLSYLRRLPVHQLKIDRSFVTDLEHSEDARAIAGAIVNLAHALRLEVVAEGVETQAQADVLCHLRCDKLQGYLFARPMSADQFRDWMRDRAEAVAPPASGRIARPTARQTPPAPIVFGGRMHSPPAGGTEATTAAAVSIVNGD